MNLFDRRVFLFVLLIAAFVFGFFMMRRSMVRQTFFDICDLVDEKFYKHDKAVDAWVSTCRRRARNFSSFATRQDLLREVQDWMDAMHVSHFMIYSPIEDRKLWKGQSVETGLRARWMDDHAIVYQVLPGSPAVPAGFHLGDEVLRINGREVQQTDEISSRSGAYLVLRNGKEKRIVLKAEAITIDSQPTLHALSDRTAVIDLSSFRSEYFSDQDWKDFVKKWNGYDRLVIDLRENSGGNFVAMLRALSPLLCQPTVIGRLVQPRRSRGGVRTLGDDLSDDNQIEQLDRTATILLKTFSGYGCYRGSVALLVGPHTASVSEIFAAALSLRPHARVFGQPTAGDVILAIWYDLPSLGEGFSISIPQAIFLTERDENLEGKGVFPEREVFDDLAVWRTGVDSWIKSAAAARF